jgi:hypothetical protein
MARPNDAVTICRYVLMNTSRCSRIFIVPNRSLRSYCTSLYVCMLATPAPTFFSNHSPISRHPISFAMKQAFFPARLRSDGLAPIWINVTHMAPCRRLAASIKAVSPSSLCASRKRCMRNESPPLSFT